MRGGRGDRQGSCRITTRPRGTREALHRECNPTLVAKARENVQAFAICGVRRGVIPLLAGDVSQVRERSRDSPPVARLAEGRERLLIALARGRQVALLTRDVALLAER